MQPQTTSIDTTNEKTIQHQHNHEQGTQIYHPR